MELKPLAGTLITASESKLLQRLKRNTPLFLWFSGIGIAVAVVYLALSLMRDTFNLQSLVLVVLILLQARANLRQYRLGCILRKTQNG